MKRLRGVVFDDSSSLEEEEYNYEVKIAMFVLLHDEIQRSRQGSQFGHLYVHRDRAEGHTKIMRDNFNPDATYM
jgi:hypothetical protein